MSLLFWVYDNGGAGIIILPPSRKTRKPFLTTPRLSFAWLSWHIAHWNSIVLCETDGLPLLSSSWMFVQPPVNSLHHLRTCWTDIHFSPYTSVNCRWISVGATFFAFKKRITVRISHLAVATSGISITDSCWINTALRSEPAKVESRVGELPHKTVLPDFT